MSFRNHLSTDPSGQRLQTCVSRQWICGQVPGDLLLCSRLQHVHREVDVSLSRHGQLELWATVMLQ